MAEIGIVRRSARRVVDVRLGCILLRACHVSVFVALSGAWTEIWEYIYVYVRCSDSVVTYSS